MSGFACACHQLFWLRVEDYLAFPGHQPKIDRGLTRLAHAVLGPRPGPTASPLPAAEGRGATVVFIGGVS